jgi:hypothetical protein
MSVETTAADDGVHADAQTAPVAPEMLAKGAIITIEHYDFEAGERVRFDAEVTATDGHQFDVTAVRDRDGAVFGLRTDGPLTRVADWERVVGAAALVVEVVAA